MRNTTGKKTLVLMILVLITVFASIVYSHCQIPCGIYSDPGRFDMIGENITTIEKSMKQIIELSKQDNPSMNQITRWVNNKEKHTDKLSHIVTYYFMSQRIEPTEETDTKEYKNYLKKLTLLHQMLVASMKAKQTTDLSIPKQLTELLESFKKAYYEKH